MFQKIFKQLGSVLTTLAIVLSVVPVQTTFAAGDLTVTYDLSAVQGQGLTSGQFHHNIETLQGAVLGGASGNGTINSIDNGNYQLRVDTIPAGYAVANNPHPIPFTITNGNTTPITIIIVAQNQPQFGDLTVNYNLPGGLGLTSGQFHHNIETLQGTVLGGASGNGTINSIAVGNYQLRVDVLPAGCIVTNNPHPIPFTINNGQPTSITVNIGNAGGCSGGPGPGVPAIVVSPTSGLITTEAGGSAIFTVVLNTLPTADVTITLTSSDLTEGTVSPASLTFTSGNGTNAQTVTVTGVNDNAADGAIAYTIITGVATSADANYNGIDPENVAVVNNDNDGGNNGGGGGRRRDRSPVIVFLYNQQTVTSVDLIAGEPATITVIATDPRNFGVRLSMLTDASQNKIPPAAFNVLNQEESSVTGTLTWTPGTDSVGTNSFVFRATNDYDITDETLPITVRVAAGATGSTGGGGGSTGGTSTSRFDEEKFKKCQFKDNSTESVVYLCMLGIIDPPNDSKNYSGKSKDFKYFGKDPITRAAFTKIMVNITYDGSAIERVAKLILANNYFPFPDVEPIAWFSKFISVAALDDLVHGYPQNGLYVPWNMIEISEAVKILFNTASHDNGKIKKDLDQATKDAKEPWFLKYALLAYAYGGYTPKLTDDVGIIYSKTLTRQQAADIIYTTILNAGIDTKGKLSELKKQLTTMKELHTVL